VLLPVQLLVFIADLDQGCKQNTCWQFKLI